MKEKENEYHKTTLSVVDKTKAKLLSEVNITCMDFNTYCSIVNAVSEILDKECESNE